MKTEKKFLSLNGREYAIVKGKRWYIEYYIDLPAGVRQRKREYCQINREKDLRKREEKALAIITKIAYSNPEDKGRTPLEIVLYKHKNIYKKKAFQTVKTRLKYFLLWLNGRNELTITDQDATAFLTYLLANGRHVSTVESYRFSIGGLYKKLNKKFNPFEDAIKIRGRYTSLMYFNDDLIVKILDYLEGWDFQLFVAVQMLYYCFIRPGEMRLLRLSDINLHHSFIEVRAEISKNKKTQKVVIPEGFRVTLTYYVATLKNKNGLVFPKLYQHRENDKGLVPWGVNYFSRKHAQALKRLKIYGRYGFYSWKHTGAVKAVRAGINIKDLQLQLRHHSLDMVNEYLKDLGVMDSDDLRFKFPSI